MGLRKEAGLLEDLPPRWLVRKGEPCIKTLTNAGAVGLHDYMGGGRRWCMWCGRPEANRGPGWTVANPSTGDVQHFPDFATAVRHASMGWYNSLDPMQRNLYLLRGLDVLDD